VGAALEAHLGRRLTPRRRLEVRLLPEPAERRHHAAREDPEPGVVLADRLVEPHPLDRDPVLGALQLGLEGEEVLVRLQLRVALDGHQQSPQRAAELVLGVLELLHGLGVVEHLRGELDPRRAGPGPRDLLQHRPLLGGDPLHVLDQVRDEIGPALVHVLDLGPLLVDALLAPDQVVADADAPGGDAEHQQQDHDERNERFHAENYTPGDRSWARRRARTSAPATRTNPPPPTTKDSPAIWASPPRTTGPRIMPPSSEMR